MEVKEVTPLILMMFQDLVLVTCIVIVTLVSATGLGMIVRTLSK